MASVLSVWVLLILLSGFWETSIDFIYNIYEWWTKSKFTKTWGEKKNNQQILRDFFTFVMGRVLLCSYLHAVYCMQQENKLRSSWFTGLTNMHVWVCVGSHTPTQDRKYKNGGRGWYVLVFLVPSVLPLLTTALPNVYSKKCDLHILVYG